MRGPALILASRSPRRAVLLSQIGVDFSIDAADIDETPQSDESPELYVQRMAVEKARAIVDRAGEAAVLAADTAVIVDGEIWGKPDNREHAVNMLRELSDRRHQVMSAVAVYYQGQMRLCLVTTEVVFGRISEAQIAAYIATGDADDKAGAYGIQGAAGSFVQRLSGSYSAVVGLPLYETVALLSEAGIGLE
jgi:septum formation protein